MVLPWIKSPNLAITPNYSGPLGLHHSPRVHFHLSPRSLFWRQLSFSSQDWRIFSVSPFLYLYHIQGFRSYISELLHCCRIFPYTISSIFGLFASTLRSHLFLRPSNICFDFLLHAKRKIQGFFLFSLL